MTAKPDISVVMGVYNGGEYLRGSIESILMQEESNFELIIVNDGSTDNSRHILEEYCSIDKRIKLITQKNQGLTHALITGCSVAQGEYIARHDAGDTSEKKRLKKQLLCIKRNPDASLISGWSRFLGPDNEHLYDVRFNPQETDSFLKTLQMDKIRGPSHHGCTLFPKKLYRKVGGYRSEFYFAQDLDLWVRLAENGRHIIIPEIFYNASVGVQSISGQYRKEQIQLARYVLKCAQLRRKGLDESGALEKAGHIQKPFIRRKTHLDQARSLYFIGKCLKKNRNSKAKKYFQQAFFLFPFHFKSGIQWLISK